MGLLQSYSSILSHQNLKGYDNYRICCIRFRMINLVTYHKGTSEILHQINPQIGEHQFVDTYYKLKAALLHNM